MGTSIMMSGFWVILALLSVAVSFIFKTNPKKNLPRGPKPWPIIGNLNLIGSLPHQSLHLLSQKYGEIMHLKFGRFPVVVASTPDMARLFLRTHDSVFASRPQLSVGKYTSYNFSDMTWSAYGPYWRQARKIYLTEMFNPRMMKSDSFVQILAEEMHDFISRLHAHSGRPVFLRDHLFRFALSSINRMVMGEKYFSESEADESSIHFGELKEMMGEWFFLSGVFNIGDWIPCLNFLDLQGYVKRMKLLHKNLDRIFEFVINDHLNRKADSKNKDFVDKLLQLAEDGNLEVKLTRDNVKALIQNLLVGGADTTPTTVEWIIHELMKHPSVYKKAKAELDKVIGRNRWVEEKDMSKLPYMEAIIMETLRLHPIATFLAPHYSIEDCQVAGYDIPKGTTILVNAWSIGRDPKTWDAPEEFSPERFLGKEIDMKGGHFGLLPFGSGRRRCPGYSLGIKSVRAMLANLLQGFDMKLEDGMKPEDVTLEEFYRLTTYPKQALHVVMEPTLPSHLY